MNKWRSALASLARKGSLALALLAFTGGLAAAQIVPPAAAVGKELPVVEIYLDPQGVPMIVENARDGAKSIQSEVTALCGAVAGSTYKKIMRGGPDYVLIALVGDKIVAGGKPVSWKGCPVDLGSFGFAPEMQPIVDSIVADWPLLAKAHNVGGKTGHFASEHLKAVLTALKKEGFGIVAEQTVQNYVGMDWPYFKASALVPSVNQVEGLVVNIDPFTYLVWKPIPCAALCMTASKEVYVHHTHDGSTHANVGSAPKAKAKAPGKKKIAATTPRKTATVRPISSVATTSCILPSGKVCIR